MDDYIDEYIPVGDSLEMFMESDRESRQLQGWVEMLIGEASDVPDFTFKELGEIVREGRER